MYKAKPLFLDSTFKVEYQEIFKKPKILKDNIDSFFNDKNKRFLVYTGGRGGGKSTSILLSILEQLRKEEFRNRDVVFARNFKELLGETKDKVKEAILGSSILSKEFEFTDRVYTNTKTNTKIKFIGLNDFLETASTKHKNNSKLKSFNNVAIFFFDEADFVTHKQLDLLIPTARSTTFKYIKEEDNTSIEFGDTNTKFIFALNPFNPNGDDVINRFKSNNKAVYHNINFMDLPKHWQDKNIMDSYLQDKKRMETGDISAETFNHIWLGQPALEDNFQPFYACEVVNCDNINDLPNFRNGIVSFDTSLGGDFNSMSIVWNVLEDGINKIYTYGFCEKNIEWSEFLKKSDVGGWLQYSFNNGFKIYYESNNVGNQPKRMMKELYNIHSYNQHTVENKKIKIQSIFPFKNQIKLISDETNNNRVYIHDLKNWKASSKNDDNADSLSMAIRKLKKLDRQ
jgi:hypothetical protein